MPRDCTHELLLVGNIQSRHPGFEPGLPRPRLGPVLAGGFLMGRLGVHAIHRCRRSLGQESNLLCLLTVCGYGLRPSSPMHPLMPYGRGVTRHEGLGLQAARAQGGIETAFTRIRSYLLPPVQGGRVPGSEQYPGTLNRLERSFVALVRFRLAVLGAVALRAAVHRVVDDSEVSAFLEVGGTRAADRAGDGLHQALALAV